MFHDILTERVSSSDPPKYRFTTVNGYLYLKVSSLISFEKGEFSELVVAVVSCSLNVRCLLSAQFLQNNSCTVLQFFILINTLSGTRSPGNFLKRLLDSPPSLKFCTFNMLKDKVWHLAAAPGPYRVLAAALGP